MRDVTQIRPWRLEDLVLTEREQRIYDQGFEHGRKGGPKKVDPFERADLARRQGDEVRADRLDRWAEDEAALLVERFGR